MNSEKLARTTFVLDREAHEQLNEVCRRLGVSRSELVRDVLAEPVAFMAKWVLSLPEQPTPSDNARALGLLQLDMIDMINAQADYTGVRINVP